MSVRNPPVLPQEVRCWLLGWDTYTLVFILKIYSSNSTLLTVVNNGCWISSNAFLASMKMIVSFLSLVLLLWWIHINIVPPTEPLFPYILERSSHCHEVRFFSMYCWICFEAHTLNHWMVWWLRKSLDKWFSTGGDFDSWGTLWYFWFSQLRTLVVRGQGPYWTS